MFRKVLVPVDFSSRDAAAVALAADLASGAAGSVTLIHVVQVVPGIDMEEEREFYERLESTAQANLTRLGEPLDAAAVAWSARIVVGSRGGEILAAAREGFDLIIVSSHRVDPQRPGAGAGTLSYHIAVAAPCPVLLVK